MKPEELVARLSNLEVAADFVEAIDDPNLEKYCSWNLSGWSYEMVPWGVRFIYRNRAEVAEVLVLAGLSPDSLDSPQTKREAGCRVILSTGQHSYHIM
ncbi:MAG: hypothetical protein AB7V46_18925 [Thermomicrobiales bacterium]